MPNKHDIKNLNSIVILQMNAISRVKELEMDR